MVLQREPQKATVWGFNPDLVDIAVAELFCTFQDKSLPAQYIDVLQDEETWWTTLEPQPAGTKCNLQIISGLETLELVDIVFGDVWICSGQSNMVFKMSQIFNATEEMEAAATYSDIRFATVTTATSTEELDDLTPTYGWSDPSNTNNLKQMSAVCFLTAKNLFDYTGVPQGLINSCVGGTPVEAWSRKEALKECNVPDHIDEEHVTHSNSVLWNAMIAPLKKMTVFGFLWYQGEANSNYNHEYYACSFPQLINDWRMVFSENSNTDAMASFGFVQLSTIQFGNAGLGFPILRNHQTADVGYVPNHQMENVFMAVAIDTYDEENGIHPRYKSIVGERLAVTGMRVAYQNKSFPFYGPHLSSVNFDKTVGFTLSFDELISYSSEAEISGFYYCCEDVETCQNAVSARYWPEVDKEFVQQVDGHAMLISAEAFTECDEAADVQGKSVDIKINLLFKRVRILITMARA